MKRFLFPALLALAATGVSPDHAAAQGCGYGGSFCSSFGFSAQFNFNYNCAYGCGYAPPCFPGYPGACDTPPALYILGYGWNPPMLPAYAYFPPAQIVAPYGYEDAESYSPQESAHSYKNEANGKK